MQLKSFKLKIFSIFLLPTIALLYFSYYFISVNYSNYIKADANIRLAKMTSYTAKLIHVLQLERGVSAGYVASSNKISIKTLIKSQKTTNKSFNQFIEFFTIKFQKDEPFQSDKNKLIVKQILKQWHYISEIRKNILDKDINFNRLIEFYSNINTDLIKMIYIFTNMFPNIDINAIDLYNLEQCKEHMGKERAYIYAAILSKNILNDEYQKIEKIILNRGNFKEEFIEKASIKDLDLYNKYVQLDLENKIKNFEQLFLQKQFNKLNDKGWWIITTQHINEVEKLLLSILNIYIKDMTNIVNRSRIAFINTILLWLLSITAFIILIYVLNNLINQELKLMNDLRISSYAFFDAYEAMLITDPNGKIMKVNNAFENITGYKEEEVIGKTPAILKSGVHPEQFYKEMWEELHTKGRWSKEIYNKRKNGEIYPEQLSITAIKNEEGVTTHYIAQFLDVSEIKEAEKKILHQATHDFLTDLPNRNLLFNVLKQELSRAKRNHYLDAFLFIDLDGFKPINDTYGHTIGDKLLVEVANRLKASIREEDYVARFGGDEFCIILVDLKKINNIQEIVKNIAEKILINLSKPFCIDEFEIKIGASIGIRIFPHEDDNMKNVINDADNAMYEAKESGRNKIIFFKD